MKKVILLFLMALWPLTNFSQTALSHLAAIDAQTRSVHLVDINFSSSTVLATSLENPHDLAVDKTNRRLLVADGSKLKWALFDGQSISSFNVLYDPDEQIKSIAVDEVRGRIFLIVGEDIHRIDLDGQNPFVFQNLPVDMLPDGISVNEGDGTLFIASRTLDIVGKSSYLGTNFQTVQDNIKGAFDIFVDHLSNHFYVIDVTVDKLYKAAFNNNTTNTNNLEDVVTDFHFPSSIDIDLDRNLMYMTDRGEGEILMVPMSARGALEDLVDQGTIRVYSALNRPTSLVLLDQRDFLQPSVTVSQPASGVTLRSGTEFNMEWVSKNNPGNLRIELVDGIGQILSASIDADDEAFTFTVPDVNANKTVRIKLTTLNDGAEVFSPSFVIAPKEVVPALISQPLDGFILDRSNITDGGNLIVRGTAVSNATEVKLIINGSSQRVEKENGSFASWNLPIRLSNGVTTIMTETRVDFSTVRGEPRSLTYVEAPISPDVTASSSRGTIDIAPKPAFSTPEYSHQILRSTIDDPSTAEPILDWQQMTFGQEFEDAGALRGVLYFYWMVSSPYSDGRNPSPFSPSSSARLSADVQLAEATQEGVNGQGESRPLSIESNGAWFVETEQDWIVVDTYEGYENQTLYVEFLPNEDGNTRQGVLTLRTLDASEEINFSQSPGTAQAPTDLLAQLAPATDFISLSFIAQGVNEIGYSVSRSENGGEFETVGSTTASPFTDRSALVKGNTYVYTVTSIDDQGNRVTSTESNAIVYDWIEAPTLVNVRLNEDNQPVVTLEDNSDNADRYVYQRTESDFSEGNFVEYTSTNREFIDQTAIEGTVYTYRGVSENDHARSLPSISRSITTADPLVAIANLTVTTKSSLQIDLNWTPADHAKGQIVMRKLEGESEFQELERLVAFRNNFRDQTLTPGTEAEYYIVSTRGNETVNSNLASGTTLSDCNYQLGTIAINCESNEFSIPLFSTGTLTSVLGIDFELEISSDLEFIGLEIPESFMSEDKVGVSHSVSGNKVIVSMYLTGSSEAGDAFSGSGELFGIRLRNFNDQNRTMPIRMTSFVESYNTGNVVFCAADGEVTVDNDTESSGSILTLSNNIPFEYNETHVGERIKIYGSNECEAGFVELEPQTDQGTFRVNALESAFIKLSKDINNGSSVISAINGNDAYTVVRIIQDPTFRPSLAAIIAADVNRDGAINATDVTLINQRSVQIIGEYSHGIDFVFIPEALLTEPRFAISTIYPEDDGVGYSKTRVPFISECIEMPSIVSSTGCIEYPDQRYFGVLLGDADLSFDPRIQGIDFSSSVGNNLIDFDLNGAIWESENVVLIPIRLKVSDVHALDISGDFNGGVRVLDNAFIGHEEHSVDGKVMFSAYLNQQGYESQFSDFSTILRIETVDGNLSINDFKELITYVNGVPGSVGFIGEKSSFETFAGNSNSRILYPNPVVDKSLQILSLDETPLGQIRIIDSNGKELYDTVVEGRTVSINTAQFSTGYYTVIMGAERSRIIKY